MEEMGRELREENARVVGAMAQELRELITQSLNNRDHDGEGGNQGETRRDRGADRREDRMRRLEVPYIYGRGSLWMDL